MNILNKQRDTFYVSVQIITYFSVMRATLTSILTIMFLSNTVVLAQDENNTLPSPPPQLKSNEFSPGTSSISWNPSMVAVIICLISAFCVIGCVSVYIHKCAEQRFMNDFAPDDHDDDEETDNNVLGSRSRRRGRRRRRATVRGLDPAIIDTFPLFLYSDVKNLKLGGLECAVCLNEFEDNETLRLLPKCSHVFHPDCIDAWLASHVTCPVCRANLMILVLPEEEEEEEIVGDSLRHHLWSPPVVLSDEIIDMEITSAPPQVMIINPSLQISEDHSLPTRTRTASRSSTTEEKFHRSHSMGHLLHVQQGEDCERFTLRLPEEVKSQLMNKSELSRAKSCVVYPRVKSSRKVGHRSKSSSEIGRGVAGGGYKSSNYYNEREVRSEKWMQGFTVVAPPFFSRGSSTRSSFKNEVELEEKTVPPRNNSLFRSVKNPFDRLFGHHHVDEKEDNGGERSFNRLRGESSV